MAGSGASVVARVLTGNDPDDGLQHAGQAVLRCSSSTELIATANTLIGSLSQRDWIDDRELIAELEHLCDGTTSALRLLRSISKRSAKRAINRGRVCVVHRHGQRDPVAG